MNELAATVSGMPETMKQEINDTIAKETEPEPLKDALAYAGIDEITVDNLNNVV